MDKKITQCFKVVWEWCEKYLGNVKSLKAYFRVNFQLERLINETRNRNSRFSVKKLAHFGIFCGSFLTFFGVKKVVFWIFSKLFKSSRGIVYEFSLTLIGILLVVLSAPKVDKWNDPRYQNFSTKNWPIMAILIGHLFFQFWV